VRNRDRAIERRNYVIDRLLENGWIKQADADKSRKDQLIVTSRTNAALFSPASISPRKFAAIFSSDTARRNLYEGGLSVRATLDPKIQVMARKTMAAGIVNYDEAQGWRGAMSKLDSTGDWGVKLADVKSLSDISPWRLAVVLETSDQSARIGFQPGRELGGAVSKERQTGIITLDGVRWAQADVRPGEGQDADDGVAGAVAGRRHLRRSAVQGRQSGRGPVPAAPIAGSLGRDGRDGPLDRPRAGDGRRLLIRPEPVQPRHPGVPAARFVIQTDRLFFRARQRLYAVHRRGRCADRNRPGEPGFGASGGPRISRRVNTMGRPRCRNALRLSLNTVTVRLAQDIGMPLIGEYARRFGVYDELPNYLSYALGAGETTVMRYGHRPIRCLPMAAVA